MGEFVDGCRQLLCEDGVESESERERERKKNDREERERERERGAGEMCICRCSFLLACEWYMHGWCVDETVLVRMVCANENREEEKRKRKKEKLKRGRCAEGEKKEKVTDIDLGFGFDRSHKKESEIENRPRSAVGERREKNETWMGGGDGLSFLVFSCACLLCPLSFGQSVYLVRLFVCLLKRPIIYISFSAELHGQ